MLFTLWWRISNICNLFEVQQLTINEAVDLILACEVFQLAFAWGIRDKRKPDKSKQRKTTNVSCSVGSLPGTINQN